MTLFYHFIGINGNDGLGHRDRADAQEALNNTLRFNPNTDEIELMTRLIVLLRRRQAVANNLTGAMIFILMMWVCTWWGDWSEFMPWFGIVPMVCMFGIWDFNRRNSKEDNRH